MKWFVVALLTASAAFSQTVSAQELTLVPYVAPEKAIDVAIPDSVRTWFTHHGVDGSAIDPASASEEVKANIGRVLVNGDPSGGNGANAGDSATHVNEVALEQLIKPALASAVQPGSVARMAIGSYVWELKG